MCDLNISEVGLAQVHAPQTDQVIEDILRSIYVATDGST